MKTCYIELSHKNMKNNDNMYNIMKYNHNSRNHDNYYYNEQKLINKKGGRQKNITVSTYHGTSASKT